MSAQSTVSGRLFADPTRFEFFQAVRLLELLHAEHPPVGHAPKGAEEFLRFRAHPSLSFAPAQLHDLFVAEGLETRKGTVPPVLTMVVNFMGLFGPDGALPQYYTELIAEPDLTRDQEAPASLVAPRRRTLKPVALRDFLDIFNHRFITLFYRAWDKYRFAVAFERQQTNTRQSERRDADRLSGYVRSLIGIGTRRIDDGFGLENLLLYYGGLLAKRPRSAVALEGILQDHFGVPVEVRQFQGRWFGLPAGNRTRLAAGGQNQLGVSAGLWARYWDPQVRFRLRLGPLSLAQFRAFLPNGNAYNPLLRLTRFVAGEDFSFDVQLVLARDKVPMCVLGGPDGGRLGWSTWAKTTNAPFEKDADQAVLAERLSSTAVDMQELR